MKLLFLFILFLLNMQIYCEEAVPAGKLKKTGRVILPYLLYTPETKVAGGINVIFSIYPENENFQHQPSFIQSNLMLTQNKQFLFSISPQIFFSDHEYLFSARNSYIYYPEEFYGLGNKTKTSDKIDYTLQEFDSENTLYKRIYDNIRAGIGVNYRYFKVVDIETEQNGEFSFLTELQGNSLLGFSFIIDYDSRDHSFIPSQGKVYNLSYSQYSDFWDNQFSFQELSFEQKMFYEIFNDHVLALHNAASLKQGDIPFLYMSKLGGETYLRGYYIGRFRDKHKVFHQLEYRFPLFWRMGAVLFTGTGKTFDKISEFDLKHYNFSVGLGIRYLLNRQDGINIRIDAAFGKDSSGLYVGILEAF